MRRASRSTILTFRSGVPSREREEWERPGGYHLDRRSFQSKMFRPAQDDRSDHREGA
jgi:hypothetical protein